MHGNKKNNLAAFLKTKNALLFYFFFLKNILAGLDSLNADLMFAIHACSKVYQVINDTEHVHEVYDVRKLSGLS